MQLVLRINKTNKRMNNWVIFFHFEMISIKFALKLSQMCGIWSTLNIYGKIFTWIIITLHKLFHWFPTSKIYTMLFLNLDGLGRYNDFWPMCVITSAIAGKYPYSSSNIFGMRKLIRVKFNMMSHWWCPLRKNSKQHNLNCIFFNGCLGWKFKNCWNDCVVTSFVVYMCHITLMIKHTRHYIAEILLNVTLNHNQLNSNKT